MTVGTCTITADQLGNGNYNAAPQVYKDITITKADQAIVFGAAPSLTFGDPPGTVSATSTSPTAPPSGTAIIFSSQTTGVCTTGGVNGSTVTIVAAGSCTIAADQAASTNYNAAPQVTQTFNIAKAPAKFTLSPPYFTPFGSATTIAGKLNSALDPTVFPASTAMVSLTGTLSYGPFATTVPVGPDGGFTASAGTVASDTYTLTFNFGGDGNFLAATPAVSSLRVEGFSAASAMIEARSNHTSTLLSNGLVLVAGGIDPAGSPKATSELYCPDTMPVSALCPVPGAFRLVTSPMPNTAARHTATLLPDGRVLVTGGGNPFAETFDPVTETWTTVAGFGPTVRSDHTATLLPNGKVLVAGGRDGGGTTLASTMLFDPVTTTFAAGGGMGTARERHTATLLSSGKVLVAGGRTFSGPNYTVLPSAEIYDPVTDTFAPAAAMTGARFAHSAALLALPDKRVVVAGGSSDTLPAPATSLSTVEIYDETLNVWTALTAANALQQARRELSMTRLTDGWLLAAGGVDLAATRLLTSELFEPGLDKFAVAAPMLAARSGHAATLLPDGRVLTTGGIGVGGVAINASELYNGPP